ncbi:STAS domain-containing protein [Amycolatopsis sp. lyj-23]|uniref:STAS domain-containing protein n=1 Tax=Amycolatopsis sp. lyj-23 TaxID=2789283 RepID=UPI00397CA336
MTALPAESGTGAVVLEVAGEVDLHSSPVLEAAIAEARASGPELLVIDLSEVSFLASIGITILLKASRQAAPVTRVRVVAPEHSTVARVFQLTGVTEALGVVPARTDALP